ncbi:hypothetical protein KI387_043487, partial [Taxus chinensis]
MANVEVHRRSDILPASPSHPHKCKLTYSDLHYLYAIYNQKCLLYSMPNNTIQDFESTVDQLKRSLSQTLVSFYPLAGRLKTCDGMVYIDCNDKGAEFIEAYAPDIGLAEIMAENFPHQIFALNGALNIDGHFMPLLVVQLTKLRDGIALAFTINHAVADGTSIWHFMRSWAQLCREPSNIPIIPLNTRCFSTKYPIKLNLQHPSTRTGSLDYFSQPPLIEKVFHFSGQTIFRLKKEAMDAYKDESFSISSYQALCGHIWQSITRARGLSPNETTTLKLTVNCRPRIVPPLPNSYFGNALQVVGATLTAGELLGSGRACAALILHRKISTHQDAQIRVELDKPPTIVHMNDFISKNSIRVGGSPRFPIYDNDFGWGRPLGCRSGCKFDGKVFTYPGSEGLGSVDVE